MKCLFIRSFLLFLILFSIWALNCFADSCNSDDFYPEENHYSLSIVSGHLREKIYFHNTTSQHGINFTDKLPYVLPNEDVIIGKTYKEWTCSFYESSKGMITVGWLPTKNLKVLKGNSSPNPLSWVGNWKQGPSNLLKIKMSKTPGFLSVDGSVVWVGYPYKEAIKRGNVNLGSVEAEGKPIGNLLLLSEDKDEDVCRVNLKLLSPYIIATDNLKCGGLNAMFFGVYRKINL